MKRSDYKALYRAWREISAYCTETRAKMKQSQDDYEYREMMRWRLDGLLDAKMAVEWILMTKNKK
jgi:hypothetical protein